MGERGVRETKKTSAKRGVAVKAMGLRGVKKRELYPTANLDADLGDLLLVTWSRR